MEVGQKVKFAKPMNDAEAAEIFVVIDDREDRVLVRAIAGFEDWSIKPETVYAVSDLVQA